MSVLYTYSAKKMNFYAFFFLIFILLPNYVYENYLPKSPLDGIHVYFTTSNFANCYQ